MHIDYNKIMDPQQKLLKIQHGFKSLKIDDKYKEAALKFLEKWLTEAEFTDYVPQIDYLIEIGNWDLLLDCFYQIIPFGTAGRRGPVGIGPNRINNWTLMNSAQGHSQFLIKKYGEQAKSRGIVIAFDVRKYLRTDEYDNNRPNPVRELDCKTLAQNIAGVYAANGLTVYMHSDFSSTPELSFMVRHLHAVSGTMISASHNPPEFNGQKVMDEFGGQLVPPFDEELVSEVVDNVKQVNTMDYKLALEQGKLKLIGENEHNAYLDATKKLSLGQYRSAKILFSPYHGTTYTTVLPVLQSLGFDITMDNVSGTPDPLFSSIVFHIPNPEVKESFNNLIEKAQQINADIILVADPDGDRGGVMSKEGSEWRFMTGNEILILVAAYILEERQAKGILKPSNTIIKTLVSSECLTAMAQSYGIKIIPDLLVGFKYIAEQMNILQTENRSDDLIMAGEESNGLTAGSHIREKDSAISGLYLAELASKLKDQNKTLGSYLDEIYAKFGFYLNYLTEIRLPGAEGMSMIETIQEHLRTQKPDGFGYFKVTGFKDYWDGEPFKSDSDKVSRNVLTFNFEAKDDIQTIKLTVRPSGTEPKIKFYIEVGVKPDQQMSKEQSMEIADQIRVDLEKFVLKYSYKIIGYDLPDRAFLLFWMLPARDKLKYFEVEPEIEALNQISDKSQRQQKLNQLLDFLGADPIQKVDKAFAAKNGTGIVEFLQLG